MNITSRPIYNNAKLFILLSFALIFLTAAILLHRKNYNSKQLDRVATAGIRELADKGNTRSVINASEPEPRKTRIKEYLYRLLTNTTRSLIQMEIKARRLEENMRRIKEKTADLLWKNKDKALWHILFKNISRHISIRHEFHQHSSLRRIMLDSHTHAHTHKAGRRKTILER